MPVQLVRGTGVAPTLPTDIESIGLSLRVSTPSVALKGVPLYLLDVAVEDKNYDRVTVGRRTGPDGADLMPTWLKSKSGWEWSEKVHSYIFAAKADGSTVALQCDGFQPSLIWRADSRNASQTLVKQLASRLGWRRRDDEPPLKLRWDFDRLKQTCGFVPSDEDPREAKCFGVVRVYFPSVRMRRQAMKLTFPGHEMHEDNIAPVQQFLEQMDVSPCTWFEISNCTTPSRFINGSLRWSTEDVEAGCGVQHIRALPPNHPLAATVPDLAILSYDIEAHSTTFNPDGSHKFPNAEQPGDEVLSIQYNLSRYMSGVVYRVCVYNLRRPESAAGTPCELPEPLDGCDVFYVDTEKEVLDFHGDLIASFNPSVVAGHNVLYFDERYLHTRNATLASLPPRDDDPRPTASQRFRHLSKAIAQRVEERETKSESEQRGKRFKCTSDWRGRLFVDTYEYTQLNYRLDSNRLDFIGRKFCGEHKEDLSPEELFDAADSRDPARIRQILVYGIQDADLVQKLLVALKAILATFVDAQQHNALVDTLTFRGPSAKAFAYICKRAHDNGRFVDRFPEWINASDDYEGATVFDAKVGLYHAWYNGKFLAVWDFSSLYPSLMRSYGICPSSYVRPGQRVPSECEVQNFEVAPGRVHRFVRCEQEPVFPDAVGALVSGRNDAKKRKREATTEDERDVWETVQKARKVCCNSLYGFLGANGHIDPDTKERVGAGPLPLVAAAETITFLGRRSIERAAELCKQALAERGLRSATVYGDTDSCFLWGMYDDVSYVNTELSVAAGDSGSSEGDSGSAGDAAGSGGAAAGVRVRFRVSAASIADKCTKIDKMMTDVGKEVSATLSEGTIVPLELAFEKSSGTTKKGGCALISKKRYAMILREPGEEEGTLKIQGLETKRRDQPATSRKLMEAVFDPLLRGEHEAAADLIVGEIGKMVRDEVPLADYVISKTLSRDPFASEADGGYALPENMEVVHVARKIVARRGEGAAPQVNDRLPFVHVYMPTAEGVAEKCDCPKHVEEAGLKVDIPYYITRAGKACERIFLEKEFPESFARVQREFLKGAQVSTQLLRGTKTVCSLGASSSDAPVAETGRVRSRDELFDGVEGMRVGIRRGRRLKKW